MRTIRRASASLIFGVCCAVVMSMSLTGSSGCTEFPGGGCANGRGSVDLSLSPGMRNGVHCARRARLNRAGFLASAEGSRCDDQPVGFR